MLITRGLAALERAEQLTAAAVPRGPYALQAAIAACHARARHAADTDWHAIAALYGELAALTPSPVVELNRAVAVVDGVRSGRPGWRWSTRLAGNRQLAGYHLLPSVRGDLLAKLGRFDEAAYRVRAGRRADPERTGTGPDAGQGPRVRRGREGPGASHPLLTAADARTRPA